MSTKLYGLYSHSDFQIQSCERNINSSVLESKRQDSYKMFRDTFAGTKQLHLILLRVEFEMYEGHLESVLRCGRCNKPFDKETTLKRHGYYCRSRRVGSAIRTRSCITCVRGKARCDNKRPECSRCKTKGVECHYPSKTSKVLGPGGQQRENNAQTDQLKPVSPSVPGIPGVENFLEGNNDGDMPLDRALMIADTESTALEGRYGDEIVLDLDFTNFLNTHIDDDNMQYTASGSSSFVYHSTSSADGIVPEHHPGSSPNLSIPPGPTQFIRSLVQRPYMGAGAHRIAKLILHNLRSYPQMVLRHNTLPPFIHPSVVSSDFGNPDPESLTNCIALVHMIGSGIQATRKLFWKNVRMECERLCEECQKLNKWELLAAMQALSIYIIIRLDEGETDYNNFDVLLLNTITAISKQLSCSDITKNVEFALHNWDLESSWKDWVFEESRRRLCVIYRVVNMLVYFEPAAMCGLRTDLVIAPLPAKKQLWEAGDELMWKVESQKEPGIQTAFGLAANGNLVQLGEDLLHSTHEVLLHETFTTRGSANWERWCSGMDGLGGLVMLAASLIG